MNKIKVLFICVHNSARSQMAQELLKKYGGDYFVAESAGYEPTRINPLVIEVMKEEGINLENKETKKVFDLFKAGKFFGYVITVCQKAYEEKCPLFPGLQKKNTLGPS